LVALERMTIGRLTLGAGGGAGGASAALVGGAEQHYQDLFLAAVVPMPATPIASIYGMNSKSMPELEWLEWLFECRASATSAQGQNRRLVRLAGRAGLPSTAEVLVYLSSPARAKTAPNSTVLDSCT
jgi:hypothetical protein